MYFWRATIRATHSPPSPKLYYCCKAREGRIIEETPRHSFVGHLRYSGPFALPWSVGHPHYSGPFGCFVRGPCPLLSAPLVLSSVLVLCAPLVCWASSLFWAF